MKNLFIFPLIILAFCAAGCLSDEGYTDIINESGKATIVSFHADMHDRYVTSIPISSAEKISLLVTAANAKGDITINFNAEGQEAVDALNKQLEEQAIAAGNIDENGDAIFEPRILMAASNYTLPSVTIPAGTLDGEFNILVASNLLDPAKKYCLPIQIVSTNDPAAVITSNFSTIILDIQIKNAYDASYDAVGTRYNFNDAASANSHIWPPTGFTSTIPWSFKTSLLTVSGNTVRCHVGQLDGGLGYMNLVVNPDNSVTIQATADTGVANLVEIPGYQSRYEPSAKTFKLYYQWTNANGTHRIVYEELKRRP